MGSAMSRERESMHVVSPATAVFLDECRNAVTPEGNAKRARASFMRRHGYAYVSFTCLLGHGVFGPLIHRTTAVPYPSYYLLALAHRQRTP